jgi:hypothetical protein
MRPPSVLIFASILASSGAALACPTYPQLVQADLGLAYTPPCTVCHSGVVGTATTATQPMALELEKLGSNLSCDPTVLATALMTMTTDKTSFDPSGTPATTLLEEGCDPNTDVQIGTSSIDGGACPGATGDAGTGDDLPPTVGYGCGAEIAGRPAPWQGAAAIAALGLAALSRRRRAAKR